jgi:hypothetical protein
VLFLHPIVLWSAEVRDVQVELDDERYHLYSETYLAVSNKALYEVLTDFEKFEKFTSVIVESKNTGPDAFGQPGFYTRMEGCVLIFCATFVRNGYLILNPISEIVAISIPEDSDFIFSRERWQLIEHEDGTLLIYDFEMEPDFWVPPVVGPFVIQRALRDGAERAVDRIEKLAQEVEEEMKAAKPVHYGSWPANTI